MTEKVQEIKYPESILNADVMRVVLNTVRDVQGAKSYAEGIAEGRKEERALIRSKLNTLQTKAMSDGDSIAVAVLDDVLQWLKYRVAKTENR